MDLKWNENAFGLTLFELLDENDYIREDAQDMPQERRFTRGWFKKSEAKRVKVFCRFQSLSV